MSIEFSLIIPTVGRKIELEQLLESINLLSYNKDKLEVIIVDQNPKGFLDDIIVKFKDKLNILHLRVNFRGAAKARNYGLKFAKGKYIHFPDDDSSYERDTLKKVQTLFETHNYDAIAVKVLDPETKQAALLNFSNKRTFINCFNFFRLTIEFNTFWKKEILVNLKGFDERLGVGTYFSSEESGDLILRALKKGCNIIYCPNIIIYHPDKRNPESEKIFTYALGFGALLRKHLKDRNICILPYTISYVGKSIVGIIIFSILNRRLFRKYKNRLLGTLKGYVEAGKIF